MKMDASKPLYSHLSILSLMLLLLLFTMLSLISVTTCETEEEAITLLREVYSKLVEAEKAGADISNASQQLNKALTLIKSLEEGQANREEALQQAISIIKEVDSMIPTLIEEGHKATFLKNLYTGLAIASIISLIILAYILTPRIFWNLWIRARKHWIVKVSNMGEGRPSDRRRG
jgi:hypothetical protein